MWRTFWIAAQSYIHRQVSCLVDSVCATIKSNAGTEGICKCSRRFQPASYVWLRHWVPHCFHGPGCFFWNAAIKSDILDSNNECFGKRDGLRLRANQRCPQPKCRRQSSFPWFLLEAADSARRGLRKLKEQTPEIKTEARFRRPLSWAPTSSSWWGMSRAMACSTGGGSEACATSSSGDVK